MEGASVEDIVAESRLKYPTADNTIRAFFREGLQNFFPALGGDLLTDMRYDEAAKRVGSIYLENRARVLRLESQLTKPSIVEDLVLSLPSGGESQ